VVFGWQANESTPPSETALRAISGCAGNAKAAGRPRVIDARRGARVVALRLVDADLLGVPPNSVG